MKCHMVGTQVHCRLLFFFGQMWQREMKVVTSTSRKECEMTSATEEQMWRVNEQREKSCDKQADGVRKTRELWGT